MPNYQYRCEDCGGVVDVFKAVSKLNLEEWCSKCTSMKPMTRVIAAVPAHVHAGTPRFHRTPGK